MRAIPRASYVRLSFRNDMTTDVTIRPAQPADSESIVSLLRVLYKGDVGDGLIGLVQEYLNSPSHLVLLAIRERPIGVLIGSYRLDVDYECRAGLVDAIVIEESVRSQKIGRTLVREFTQWARDRGCTMLQVINPDKGFFEASGFKERPLRFQQMGIEEAET